jgi:phosphoglycolate phosphatase
MLREYSTLLFDLDGTLVDSSNGILESYYYAFNNISFDYSNVDLMQLLGPPIEIGLMKLAPDVFSNEATLEHTVKLFREHYSSHGIHNCNIYNGIKELLSYLYGEGKQLIVATSKLEVNARQILKNLKLYNYFTNIVGSNLERTLILKKDIIHYIITNYVNCDPKLVLMIGDRDHDINGAKYNNIDSLAVGYGYGNLNELTSCNPTLFAANPTELKILLLNKVK